MLMSDARQTVYQTKTRLTSPLVCAAKLAMVIHFRTQKEIMFRSWQSNFGYDKLERGVKIPGI